MAEDNPRYKITADGDTILVIGPEEARLCVHSFLLQAASKVFKAMFGPHFKEGQRSDLNGSKKEIPLPEDDVDAMTVVCAVIHHRNDLTPEKISSSEILQIAVVADKYDCRVALKHATHHWLDHRNVVSLKELMQLMTAAYLLHQKDPFSAITHAIIMEHNDSYLSFAQDQIDFGVPWEVFCIILAVNDKDDDCSCSYKAKSTYSYLRQLNKEGLLPSLYDKRDTAVNRIKKAERMGPQNEVESSKSYKQSILKLRHEGDFGIARRLSLLVINSINTTLVAPKVQTGNPFSDPSYTATEALSALFLLATGLVGAAGLPEHLPGQNLPREPGFAPGPGLPSLESLGLTIEELSAMGPIESALPQLADYPYAAY
ncbi:hypothetical protein V495_06586 [Pseudogymnoascus sp. VKM F-4514 (FW-929)]|nr:hypothetical protein V495_06586 [Pseudogymnoascus sp. VKM F-4514 (FW-929)]KFY65733.1 hypothetical protein V497_01324 [Pseudogymnoascus sp. VKM F-4516 (FW-969)]